MSDAPASDAGSADVQAAVVTAGRELKIFLDMMAAYATDNHSYLLAPAYNQGLADERLDLRGQLLPSPGRSGLPRPPKCGARSTKPWTNWFSPEGRPAKVPASSYDVWEFVCQRTAPAIKHFQSGILSALTNELAHKKVKEAAHLCSPARDAAGLIKPKTSLDL